MSVTRITAEQRDWLTLVLVPGIGTTHFIRLLARFRTPGRVLSASEAELAEVVGRTLAQRIRQYREATNEAEQERLMAKYEAGLITMEDPAYPPRLAEIYDPPLVLFHRGELLDRDEYCVAIVGTRKASPYGVRTAETLGRELASRGITVVSGMAHGIDAAAHRGAIEGGGRTIAVLGCGVDVVYPEENADLMHRIIRHGCVLSQFPMGTKPSKGLFPYRNRIISGLSMGTCIVEAPLRSGALITARQAAEQGREVFAVPGQVGYENSQGPHALIREGAKLVESIEDILAELDVPPEMRVRPAREGHAEACTTNLHAEARTTNLRPEGGGAAAGRSAPVPAVTKPQSPVPKPSVTPSEQAILEVLSPDGSFVDEIAMASRLSVAEALSSLTILELKGLVRQFSGKRFAPR
ncbi:MAG TPA: DNA-processing protein DprA [Candidatus Hydrogenedentes bacterium]|nr:DNA-processing protein DprA [Candidatus Hydrogenedentota bacterium]